MAHADQANLRLHTPARIRATGLFGAFQDASPDSWGRHLLDRAAEEYGVRPTEFDYLTVLDQESRIVSAMTLTGAGEMIILRKITKW